MNKGAQPLPQSIMHQNDGELLTLCIQVILIKSPPPALPKIVLYLYIYIWSAERLPTASRVAI